MTPTDALSGMPVRVDRNLCQSEFVRWKRTHRKSRIAKKWRKRYGPVVACKGGQAYQIRGLGLCLCPCTKRQLDKAIEERNR